MLWNNQQIMGEIKKEIKICIETNDNENMTNDNENLWDLVKAGLRWKFITIQAYLKKLEKHQINNLTLLVKHLLKKKNTPKVSRRKEIIKSENK